MTMVKTPTVRYNRNARDAFSFTVLFPPGPRRGCDVERCRLFGLVPRGIPCAA